MGSRNSRVRIRNETNDTIRVMLVKYNKYGETVKLFNTRKLKNNELIQINSIKYGRYTLKVFDMTGKIERGSFTLDLKRNSYGVITISFKNEGIHLDFLQLPT